MPMANPNVTSPPPLASPTRPGGRHQVKRSITELASPVKIRAPGQLARKRAYQAHHAHHHHRGRSSNDLEPQTAHPALMRSSLDTPRPEATGNSRRASTVAWQDEVPGRATAAAAQPPAESRDDVLRRELQRSGRRVEDLKQSLVELHSFSTTTTRRLDESYYAVLEKTSALQGTVAALKTLAEESRDIYQKFDKDSRELEDDITRQVAALGPFEDQERKIRSLQSRMQDGRSKILALAERVDEVRNRVETWERTDHEWQGRSRRRHRVIWSVFLIVVLAIIALSMYLGNSSSGSGMAASGGGGGTSSERTLHYEALNISRQVPVLDSDGGGGPGATSFPWARRGQAGDRLREFDEL